MSVLGALPSDPRGSRAGGSKTVPLSLDIRQAPPRAHATTSSSTWYRAALCRQQRDAGVERACELGECPGAGLDDAALDLRDFRLSDPGALRELGLAETAVEAQLEKLVRDPVVVAEGVEGCALLGGEARLDPLDIVLEVRSSHCFLRC